MDHNVHDQSNGFAWRPWLAFFAFAAIAGYFLFSEHRVHVLAILPWALVLLACPLLHVFMHGGHGDHGGHGGRAREEGDVVALERNRDGAPPATEPGPHRH